jgi:hypothetical protein
MKKTITSVLALGAVLFLTAATTEECKGPDAAYNRTVTDKRSVEESKRKCYELVFGSKSLCVSKSRYMSTKVGDTVNAEGSK